MDQQNKSLRPKIITGNWKMYKTIGQAVDFARSIVPLVEQSIAEVYLAVPFTAIQAVEKELQGSRLVVGAQNMNDASEGAFTGEIAGRMIKDAGAKFVLLGHSERRRYFHESNAFINQKMKRAVIEGLQPVLCIGETQADRDSGKANEVLHEQLTGGLAGLRAEDLTNLIIAYEPVWAVGTGQNATPELAQETHVLCRGILSELYGQEFASKVVIQYGGSVTTVNAKSYMEQADIDGLLIGGASLSLETFAQIVNDVRTCLKSSTA